MNYKLSPGQSVITRLADVARRRISGLIQDARESSDARERIAFLHIGKNAGTQFVRIANQVNAESPTVRIEKIPHHRRFGSLGAGERYLFSIRSPISRFQSGFYSRKRKGAPRLHSEWTTYEAKAFETFEHANDLAEALFQEGPLGMQALCAIKSIRHCSMDQISWFDQNGAFLQIRPPVTIIRQEHFDEDVGRFLKLIDFGKPVQLTDDPTLSHRNDYSGVPPLSEKAVENLRRWYAQDLEFYKVCESWLRQTQL